MEAPESQPAVIYALRTPLESGVITLGRSEVHARFPARFQLILAANPCPCGQAATPGAHCRCSPTVVRRHAEKISGPYGTVSTSTKYSCPCARLIWRGRRCSVPSHLPLPDGLQAVDEAVDRGRLSARGVDKVLRFGWMTVSRSRDEDQQL
jgi:magnesium chelatase family protein